MPCHAIIGVPPLGKTQSTSPLGCSFINANRRFLPFSFLFLPCRILSFLFCWLLCLFPSTLFLVRSIASFAAAECMRVCCKSKKKKNRCLGGNKEKLKGGTVIGDQITNLILGLGSFATGHSTLLQKAFVHLLSTWQKTHCERLPAEDSLQMTYCKDLQGPLNGCLFVADSSMCLCV